MVKEKSNNKPNLLKCTFIYFVSAFLFLILRILTETGVFGERPYPLWLQILLNGFVQIGVMFLIPAALYLWFHKKKPREMLSDFQFNKISGATVGISVLTGFAVFMCVIVISSFMSGILQAIGYRNPFSSSSSGNGSIWIMLILPIFTSAVLPGFCEEFINRGLLQNSLNRISPRRAIFLSAVLFACLHYNINQVFYAFFVGIVLGAITHFSKSIWPAIIIHFTNNFCSVFFDFAEKKNIFGHQFNNFVSLIFEGNTFLVVLKFMLFAIVGFSALAYALYYLYRFTMPNRMNAGLKDVAEKYLGGGVKTKEGLKFEAKDVVKNIESYEGEILIKLKDKVVKNITDEISSNKTIFEKFVPKQKMGVTGRMETIFLYAAIFMTSCLTFFTFMWGML